MIRSLSSKDGEQEPPDGWRVSTRHLACLSPTQNCGNDNRKSHEEDSEHIFANSCHICPVVFVLFSVFRKGIDTISLYVSGDIFSSMERLVWNAGQKQRNAGCHNTDISMEADNDR